jgi:hypothetical protein
MTGIAVLLGGLAVMLIWGGITGKNPFDEFKAVLVGTKKLPNA